MSGFDNFRKEDNLSSVNIIDISNEEDDQLVDLLTHSDRIKIPNSTLKDDYICYKAAKDFTFNLPRSQVLNDLVDIIVVNNNTHFQWKKSEQSNFNMVQLLKNNEKFPPQIAIAIKKTHKNFSSKMLKLDLYCQGCYGNRNKDRTIFSMEIDKKELLLKETINIIIKFNKTRNSCKHEQGKSYGQLRGFARKQSAIKMKEKKLQPRHLCQYALNNISSETHFTGNRQNVPTANAARTLSSQVKRKINEV